MSDEPKYTAKDMLGAYNQGIRAFSPSPIFYLVMGMLLGLGFGLGWMFRGPKEACPEGYVCGPTDPSFYGCDPAVNRDDDPLCGRR